MYNTMCIKCGVMVPANEAPVLGYYNTTVREWSSSLCKPCWLKEHKERGQ